MIAALLLAGLAVAGTPDPVARWTDRVDWDAAGDEAVALLSDYLRVDTTNPPGREGFAVEFLGERLDAEGIPWEAIEHAPGRESLVAWLDATGRPEEGPLCLLSHLDVVGADSSRWDEGRGPLSGAVADGYVWGRGALDMKGMGAIELLVLAWLKRLGVPLRRDVVLIAVADEEVDNLGMRDLVAHHWDRIGCTHLVNEGGLGVRDALFEGQTVHAISVAEKGTLWLRMHADGRAGHGSTPYPGEAPERLVEAMARIERRWRPRPRIHPAMVELLREIGRDRGGLAGAVLRSRLLVNVFVRPRLMANPATRAALTDTVHLTGMSGAGAINVVPGRVSAQLDARLLPGTDPHEVVARLERIVRKVEGISFEVVQSYPAAGSPWDDPLYRAIARRAVGGRPGHVAGPVLSVGFTDSIFARPLGVRAYGYVPFEVTEEEAGTMHGDRERVPVGEVGRGLRVLFEIVVEVAAEPG